MMTEHEVVAVVDGLTLRRLRAWVRQGWVRPTSREGNHVFSEVDTARLRLMCHLRMEMNVNEDALPVVLSLMDQLYGVRRDLRCLMEAVDTQSSNVRVRILKHAQRTRQPGRRPRD